MYYSKGGLTKHELEEMPFDIYEKWLEEAIRVQKILSKENIDG